MIVIIPQLTDVFPMITLITKIQYKNFEPGEFVEVQKRTYEETIRLIEEYPWNIQREKFMGGLTNPSVTIEGRNGDYLKLAVFFNQKYVLLYLENNLRIFSLSFKSLQDGYAYIKCFFEQPVFDLTDFKKESIWFENKLKHFVTQDFRYELTTQSIKKYWLSVRGFNIIVPAFFLIVMAVVLRNAIVFLWPGIIFIWGAVMPLRLFFIYYNYAKDKVLIMSKANDTFYFGSFDDMVKYDKKDILKCTIVKTSRSRSIYNGFAVVKLEFVNGTMLSLPNLLIDHRALEDKLFQCRQVRENKSPYL